MIGIERWIIQPLDDLRNRRHWNVTKEAKSRKKVEKTAYNMNIKNKYTFPYTSQGPTNKQYLNKKLENYFAFIKKEACYLFLPWDIHY